MDEARKVEDLEYNPVLCGYAWPDGKATFITDEYLCEGEQNREIEED